MLEPDVRAGTSDGMDPTQAPYTYDAFISYRRRLGATAVARWIRTKLKRYKPPADLLVDPRLPESCRERLQGAKEVFLDTAYSRANEDFWARQIVPSLRDSHVLIVISTPEVFERRRDGSDNWVVHEIKTFWQMHKDPTRLVLVLGPGAAEDQFPGMMKEISLNWDWVDLRPYSRFAWLWPRRPSSWTRRLAKSSRRSMTCRRSLCLCCVVRNAADGGKSCGWRSLGSLLFY
jgi:hypothetical protein